MMTRRRWTVMGCLFLMVISMAVTASAAQQPKTELQRMKLEHKAERKSLKVQEKAWKQSFRGRPIPRADRIREKHQMQRNMRNMKQRQKDQIQDYKDQRRIQKQIRTS